VAAESPSVPSSQRQPHVQGEQQGSDVSSSDTLGQQPHVQGEQQSSAASSSSSSDIVDLHIVLRKGTREVARKTLCEMHALQTVSNDHDIGNFMSYETLSPSYRVLVASLQIGSIAKGVVSIKPRH
jgi:hypothetical protein